MLFWRVLKTILTVGVALYQMSVPETCAKECNGMNSGPGYVLYDSRSSELRKQFKNCTVVRMNVEIISFHEPIEDDFLDSIEEVKGYILVKDTNLTRLSMNKLRLIRGKTLYNDRSSIHVEDNQSLEKILFPSLREISDGDVEVVNNPRLCFADRIGWKDFMYNDSSRVNFTLIGTTCPQCEPDCDKCWSENVCQEVRKEYCKSTSCRLGCSKSEGWCCNEVCAGGCFDSYGDACPKCRNVRDNNDCKAQCPSLLKFDNVQWKNVPNPEGKYQLENDCKKICPRGTMPHEKLAICTIACQLQSNGECKACPDKSCPNVCFETSVNSGLIANLMNCTVIAGPLKILNNMVVNDRGRSIVPLLEEILVSVKNVTDAVAVQGMHEQLTDLSSLRNLEIIGGFREDSQKALLVSHTSLRSLKLWSLSSIGNGDLWITNNPYLESLELVSLQNVDGSIVVRNNTNLCFVNSSTFRNITKQGRITVEQNKDPHLCEKEGKICHEECLGGCWGPGNNQCRSCKNVYYRDLVNHGSSRCLSSCRDLPNLYESVRSCVKCHDECKDGCSGDGPFNCSRCRTANNEGECVKECPAGKYLDSTSRECRACHSHCKGGCTGPSSKLAHGGCKDCHLLLNSTGQCVNNSIFECNTTRFVKYEDLATSIGIIAISVCYDCHHLCRTCSGEGSHACECLFAEYKGGCLDECPPQHYKDPLNRCHLCHTECDGCHGPSSFNCSKCKNVRIRLDEHGNATFWDPKEVDQSWSNQTLNKTDSFVCNATCPPHAPDKRELEVNGGVQRECFVDGSPSQTRQNAIIGVSVFGVLLVLGIPVVIFHLRKRQKAKQEENETKMRAQIEGIDAFELLTPSKVRPDSMNCLRLIKESELDRRQEIGTGNFGTVYEGIWHPEGEKVRVAVAIKILTEESSSAQHKELLEEARVMASVGHPCCIRILAVCLGKQMMLITPLMAHRSMLEYLQKNTDFIGSHAMLRWATQIARGMNHLEGKGIVHRNLAARNVMVQGINQVKISDYLLPKLASHLNENQKLEIPVKWLSLETIQYYIFTHKSDVWSYGITLWELFTYGRRPYENISAVDMADHLEMGERLPQPPICTIDVYMVMIKCWMADANSRPTFQELEEEFSTMMRDPGRFLVIQGDKLMRVPSDFMEDNQSELKRQMNLSDSEDILCGEEYHYHREPSAFSFSKTSFSKKLTSLIEEEEETSFQTAAEYTNVPRKTPKSISKQDSSASSVDGTFAHLEAATADLEGSRKRKPSTRYFASPTSEDQTDLIIFDETPRPPSLDEKDLLKLDRAYTNQINCDQRVHKDDYLEPSTNAQNFARLDANNSRFVIENPEYMGEIQNNNNNSIFRSKF